VCAVDGACVAACARDPALASLLVLKGAAAQGISNESRWHIALFNIVGAVSFEVDLVTAYWTAAEDRDWEAFAALIAEDIVYEAPQSRERVRGRSAYVRFNRDGFPGEWHLQIVKIVGGNCAAASWISMTYADGTAQPGVSFFEIAERNMITRISDFWPEPYKLPASRAHLVEKY
jgi:SnoaL-like domain